MPPWPHQWTPPCVGSSIDNNSCELTEHWANLVELVVPRFSSFLGLRVVIQVQTALQSIASAYILACLEYHPECQEEGGLTSSLPQMKACALPLPGVCPGKHHFACRCVDSVV